MLSYTKVVRMRYNSYKGRPKKDKDLSLIFHTNMGMKSAEDPFKMGTFSD